MNYLVLCSSVFSTYFRQGHHRPMGTPSAGRLHCQGPRWQGRPPARQPRHRAAAAGSPPHLRWWRLLASSGLARRRWPGAGEGGEAARQPPSPLPTHGGLAHLWPGVAAAAAWHGRGRHNCEAAARSPLHSRRPGASPAWRGGGLARARKVGEAARRRCDHGGLGRGKRSAWGGGNEPCRWAGAADRSIRFQHSRSLQCHTVPCYNDVTESESQKYYMFIASFFSPCLRSNQRHPCQPLVVVSTMRRPSPPYGHAPNSSTASTMILMVQ